MDSKSRLTRCRLATRLIELPCGSYLDINQIHSITVLESTEDAGEGDEFIPNRVLIETKHHRSLMIQCATRQAAKIYAAWVASVMVESNEYIIVRP